MTRWWQEADVSHVPAELQDLLGGAQFDLIAPDEDRREKVATVETIGAGFDRNGMFGFVKVTCESDVELTLYTDGTIHDDDDQEVGRHDFVLLTAGDKRTLVKA